MENKNELEIERILDLTLDAMPIPEIAKELTKQFREIRRELSKESDRGLALYATAHIDIELEKLLKSKLIGSEQHLKEVLSFNGPLGTFSSKIKLSYSLGLINKVMMDDINTLRKIRNEFAHSDENISFNTQKIKDLCDNLQLNVREEDALRRKKYMNVVAGIAGQLYGAQYNSAKFEELKDIDLSKRKEIFDLIFSNSIEQIGIENPLNN